MITTATKATAPCRKPQSLPRSASTDALRNWGIGGGRSSPKGASSSPRRAPTGGREGRGGGGRGETRARVRKLTPQADPKVVEKWKGRGVRVGKHDGQICTGES